MIITLIGYMGAGKTTIGQALAQHLDMPFRDLDWYIESQTGKTIAQIFSDEGENGFRQVEHQMLQEALLDTNQVLAVGGGTPCFYNNMECINRQSVSIYLKAEPETLMRHIRMGTAKRPLVDGKTDNELIDYIDRSLLAREPFYSQAIHTLNIETITTQVQIDNYVNQIARLIP